MTRQEAVETVPQESPRCEVEIVHATTLDFAMEHCGIPIIAAVRVKNVSSAVLEGARLEIGLFPDLGAPIVVPIPRLPPAESFERGPLDVRLPFSRLRDVVEAANATLHWTLVVEGKEIAAETRPLRLLAFNEWPGDAAPLELLAAFVTPNQPAIATVLERTRDRLRSQGGDDALRGYQARSPERAVTEIRALYAAVQGLSISYVGLPASYEKSGQKVRLPDQLLRDGMGNCLDLTLLFASCLEQMGYGPLLVLVEGHALPAVWIVDERFQDAVVPDVARLRNQGRLAQILAFDASTAVSGQRPSLEVAVAAANDFLAQDAKFIAAIDVRAARRARFLPLPIALRSAVETEPAQRDVVDTDASQSPVGAISLPDGGTVANLDLGAAKIASKELLSPRIQNWKERLLDLTLRNRLLDVSRVKNRIPLEIPDLAAFEDKLAADVDFEIMPYPKLEGSDPRARELLDLRTRPAEFRERLTADLDAHRLHATLTSDLLVPMARALYRKARTDLEEGGANTLYVVLGILRWYESPSSKQARHAPLLLVPVRLSYEPRLDRIRLRRTEEDAIGNVTLVEKLKRDFALDLSFLAELAPDDSGIDVGALLKAVRAAIQSMPRFEVIEEASVTTLLFGKFLMWRDLEVNASALLSSKIVRHLADGGKQAFEESIEGVVDPGSLDSEVSPADLPTVVDADSTQCAAILAAMRGQTFVLQGPPGTGKSQTITNIIAAALSQGRTVLFVSEKMAALDVVHRRLKEVGLADSCLELHSTKTSKRQVLESIGRSVTRSSKDRARLEGSDPSGTDAASFDSNAARLVESRTALNEYVRALHTERPLGMSFFRAASRVLEIAPSPLELPLRDGIETTAATLASQLEKAAIVASRGARVEPVAEHPWRDSALAEWSGRREAEIESALKLCAERLAELAAARDGLAVATRLQKFDSREGVSRVTDFVNGLLSRSSDASEENAMAPSFLRDDVALALVLAEVENLAVLLAADEADRAEIAHRFESGVFHLGDELALLRLKFEEHAGSNALVRFFALRGARKRLRVHAKDDLPEPSLVARDLARVEACAAREARIAALRQAVAARLLAAAPHQGASSQALRAWVERVRRLRTAIDELDRGGILGVDACVAELAVQRFPSRDAIARAAALATKAVRACDEAFVHLAEIAALAGASEILDGRSELGAQRDRVLRRIPAMPRLREWCGYVRACDDLSSVGLEDAVEAHRKGVVSAASLPIAVERALLLSFVRLVRDAEPVLRDFDGEEQARRIAEFRRRDLNHLTTSRTHVLNRLDERRPRAGGGVDVPGESEPGILGRELKKKARHLPLRRLFQRIPNLIARLKPCFLMSPLSVAQFLPPEGRRFDLVVFDEASQIGTHDAIGAIARGSQVVIVGDSRQLPPTAFFQRSFDASAVDEAGDGDGPIDDGADYAIEELESVLDEAVAARLPERYLGWHYRSRHESLIRFSNLRYYDERLALFPSARRRDPDLGVKWHPVIDGEYEFAGSRTNPREARVLVDWLVKRLREVAPGKRSFGIVTFSQPQQTLVLDLLDEARRKSPEIEGHFAADLVEPVFVKNLENVQGDERDEILFSICYGRSRDGKVRMNFGPLSQSGGERRLNVAVTRARASLHVFSTLSYDEIDLNRTTARGAHHLREFLRYAVEESGTSPQPESNGVPHDSEFERQVGAALVGLGMQVDARVGCGRYRIDLAVRDPSEAGVYVLGVECDGAAYRSGNTARDRDRLREQVLGSLGWRLHRVWSSDWWFDREREIEKLRVVVAAAIEASRAKPVAARSESVTASDIESSPGIPDEIAEGDPPASPVVDVPPYVRAALPNLEGQTARFRDADPTLASRIRELVLQVVAVEGPVHIDTVVRSVARAFGVRRITEKSRESLLRTLDEMAKGRTITLLNGFVWSAAADPSEYDEVRGAVKDDGADARGIDEISVEELAAAAERHLTTMFSLPVKDLVRMTARTFGILRVSKESEVRLRAAIEMLIARGRAREADSRIHRAPSQSP